MSGIRPRWMISRRWRGFQGSRLEYGVPRGDPLSPSRRFWSRIDCFQCWEAVVVRVDFLLVTVRYQAGSGLSARSRCLALFFHAGHYRYRRGALRPLASGSAHAVEMQRAAIDAAVGADHD